MSPWGNKGPIKISLFPMSYNNITNQDSSKIFEAAHVSSFNYLLVSYPWPLSKSKTIFMASQESVCIADKIQYNKKCKIALKTTTHYQQKKILTKNKILGWHMELNQKKQIYSFILYSLSKIENQKGLNRIQDVFLIKALACMDGMQYRLFVG